MNNEFEQLLIELCALTEKWIDQRQLARDLRENSMEDDLFQSNCFFRSETLSGCIDGLMEITHKVAICRAQEKVANGGILTEKEQEFVNSINRKNIEMKLEKEGKLIRLKRRAA